MNVEATPSPFEAMGATQAPGGNAPVLGTPVPGTTGGLPAQGGLSVLANPMAEQLRSMGRGEDTMLVHMTPNEVNSLQGLAQAAGGSLTINPDTGLPEASFLKRLLPTLLGVGLNFVLPGSGLVATLGGKAATAGLLTAAGTTALTGSLRKGLMAGLGAYGGASLAGGVQGAIRGAAAPGAGAAPTPATLPGRVPNLPGPNLSGVPTPPPTAPAFSPTRALGVSPQFAGAGTPMPAALGGGAALPSFPSLPAVPAVPELQRGLGGFTQGFANTARGTMTGLGAELATPLAAAGVLGALGGSPSNASDLGAMGAIDNSYEGPYTYEARPASYRSESPIVSRDSSPHLYFPNSQPGLLNVRGELVQPGSSTPRGTPIVRNVLNPRARRGEPMYIRQLIPYMGIPQEEERFAEGGEVHLADGAFVVDARTVSEVGNGSSNAGQEALARLGGRPIRGPGDGVSDSIPARIGRDQPARVARDEVVFPPEAVRRVGGGNERRGADKLYALMKQAHKARRGSARGKDTGLRRGLA